MARFIVTSISLLAVLALSACGGGADNASPAGNTPAANTGGSAANTDKATNPDDPPKEDPDLWKKITTPTPKGWEKLAKDGQAELRKDGLDLLKKPGSEFFLLAAFGDKEAPHASSGTDEDWEAWRNEVSAVFVYNASKTKDDTVETLKKHGASFVEGFDGAGVRSMNGIALYIQPDAEFKWLACVSNERGTYILTALVRNDDASNLMKQYPATIKPE